MKPLPPNRRTACSPDHGHNPVPRFTRAGFTLIELLVVVTIIVVLLALLVPAMDQAIYQAELAVCGSQQHNIVNGAIAYAMNSRRYYPVRGSITPDNPTANQPQEVRYRQGAFRFDDTQQLQGYIAMGRSGHMNCPLTGRVDVINSDPDTWVLAPYAFYFGWRFTAEGNRALPGMKRMGDSLRWGSAKISVLVADDDMPYPGNATPTCFTTHPDALGKLSNLVKQDEGVGPGDVPIFGTSTKTTFSRWGGGNNPLERGPVELNFGFQDGSVGRYDEVAWDEPEDRVIQVPFTWKSPQTANSYRHLPAR